MTTKALALVLVCCALFAALGCSDKPSKGRAIEHPIYMGAPDASRKLTVYYNPRCPVCNKFHIELEKLTREHRDIGVSIVVIPYFTAQPGTPGSGYDEAKTILCAGTDDKALALIKELADDRKILSARFDCNSDIVERNLDAAMHAGVTGTPTVVLPNGMFMRGGADAETVLDLLDGRASLINGGTDIKYK